MASLLSSLPQGYRKLAVAALLPGALALSACGSGESPDAAAEQQMQPQATPVETVSLNAVSVPSTRSLPARATAFAEAEIRPQVSGLIEKRLFTEGQQVKEGDALYQIDRSEYRAALESARASLARAEATAATAQETANRFQRLSEINAVSKQSYDEAVAAAKQAAAEVGIQKAALDRAQIDLARTTIKAPIDGQIGRSTVTQGALVTASQATMLARILQLDPIYIDMTASSSEVLRWRQDVAAGKIRTSGENAAVPVTVRLEDGSEYPIRGTLEFTEVSVDEAAGTVIVRAQVPNPDGLILPGTFLKAEFSAGTLDDVYRVPQGAVQRNARGEAFAFIVGDDGTAKQVMLDIQQADGSDWIVTGGLETGQELIVSGFQMLRAGAPVKVTNADPSNMTAMAAGNSDIASE